MSRKSIPPEFCMYVVFLRGGAYKWIQKQLFLLAVGSFLLTAELLFFAYKCAWELICLLFEFLTLQFLLFCSQLNFFAYSGEVCLRSTPTDCKQRSSTVSKKSPTVSNNASPILNSETCSTCSQHVTFSYANSPELHACIFYMGKYCSKAGVNDAHV